jgi:DNA-binding response OmpR family regulator
MYMMWLGGGNGKQTKSWGVAHFSSAGLNKIMRILIVEDEDQVSNVLKKSLEAECFIVDVAKDGIHGLSLARSTDYDLVVLDNFLPKKTGVEVCRELRTSGKSMPIIILSVKSETTTKVELLNAGADDYLIKPFSFEEVLARVHALLRRPRQLEKDILIAGDLSLDTKQHVLRQNGKEVYLSRKEFILLEYLMRNQGNVLSRAMLLEHVWDMNTDPFSNTIESHILSLRKKIERPGKGKFIQTLPGRGYKFAG